MYQSTELQEYRIGDIYIYISKLRRELENEIRDWPANDGQFARWKKVLSKDGKGKNPI